MQLSGVRGLVIGQQATLWLVVKNLSARLGRPVADETEPRGYYDFRQEWTPDETAAPVPVDHAGPPVFTALQEQLGLKPEARKGPVEVLIIESAERPSSN